MQKLMMATVAVAVGATVATGFAQSKTVPVKMEVMTATVDAIDRGARSVTVTKSDGKHEVFYVPASVQRFDSLKVGDQITAKHYENVVLQVKAPGAPDSDKSSHNVVSRSEKSVSGTVAHQRTITATIAAIDPHAPSITFTGANGWQYESRVEDTAALAKFKVGDKVDITWTEALIVSIDDVK
jgi:hypothetical protein